VRIRPWVFRMLFSSRNSTIRHNHKGANQTMILHLPSNPITGFTLGACLLFAWDPTEAFADISVGQALAIADKAIVRHGVHVPPWVSKVDKVLEDWHLTRASWEKRIRVAAKGRSEEIEARIVEIEKAIKGKDVWLVVYRYPANPAQRVLLTHAIVFLDSKTGDVLEIIHPGE
jgi:hypothetical protein